jgi:putative ABC transport system permease protein
MEILTDVRLALRRLRGAPAFSAGVIGTLALGLAAATSIYTVVDGVLLKPLPFPDSARLVRVGADFTGRELRDVGLSQPELDDYAKRSGAFESITGIWSISANVTGSDRPERVEVLLTGASYFSLLGAKPALGRTFVESDAQPGIAAPIVISDAFWRRGYGASPSAIGRTLRIDGDPYEIIGVMPADFRHPAATVETDVDVWAASGWTAPPFPPPAYGARYIRFAIGRLRPGVSLDEARARVENLGRQLAAEHPDDYPARLGWTPRVTSVAADLVQGVRPALWVLMGAIVFLLVIAITNISNLLLARAAAREREIAVQRALGASTWRVARTLLIEGAVLTTIGAGVGLLICPWLVTLLLASAPEGLPRTTDVRIDLRALLFAVAVAIVTSILVSLAPALQSSRAEVIDRLKEMGRGVQGGRRARLVRRVLVIAQVATAIVLMAGAGLLARSLRNLTHVDTGIGAANVLTTRIWLPQPNDPSSGVYFRHDARVAFMQRVLARLQSTPGMAAAGLATALPLEQDGGRPAAFTVEGWPPDKSGSARAAFVAVSPGYFDALGVHASSGRLIEDRDDARMPRVAVVNRTAARAFFAGEDPVGRRLQFVDRGGQVPPNAPFVTVVGVVADIREDGIDAVVPPALYVPLWQSSGLQLTVVARGVSALPSGDSIRAAVQQSDPNVPLYAMRSIEDLAARGLAQRRFAARLIAAFAALALMLAAFGLHSVIAYNVRLRTHEIGVRLALGATPSHVLRMVLAEGLGLAALGAAAGITAALGVSRLLSTLLFNVSPRDPLTLVAVVVVLLTVAALATLAAASRAARIELAAALRPE